MFTVVRMHWFKIKYQCTSCFFLLLFIGLITAINNREISPTGVISLNINQEQYIYDRLYPSKQLNFTMYICM